MKPTPNPLRAWRNRLGLTQQQIADGLGISRSSWLRYESGRSPAPLWLRMCEMAPLSEARAHFIEQTTPNHGRGDRPRRDARPDSRRAG